MKAAPAPARGVQPQPSPALSRLPECGTGPGTDVGTDAASSRGGNREGSGRWSAAMLLLTHVVEVAAMVAATLAHALALPPPPAPHEAQQARSPADAQGTLTEARPGTWGASAVVLQAGVGGAPLLLVTTISLVWAVRAQDFSGRATARMLCWLLHLLQASILWRFLKVHLAFDPSDVAELGTLRFVQVHVHTLPFLVVHVATVVGGAPGSSVLSLLLAVAMVVSGVVAIVVATTASPSSSPSSLTPPTITQIAHHPVHGAEHSHDAAARVVVAVTTSCVVWTRAVAMAALLCLHLAWAGVLMALHWIAALVWLSLQKELEPPSLGPFRRALRRAFLAYLLLWDWHVFRDDASALTVCARPRLPAAYYTITAIQNVAITATWYSATKVTPLGVRTAVFSSVLATQAVALLLLALSYLYCSSLLPAWPRDKGNGPATAASLVTLSGKSAKPAAPLASAAPHHNNSYVDFKDVEEGITEAEGQPDTQEPLTPIKNLPPMAHSTPRTPLPLAPRLMATHLPPTIFSFSHDALPPRLSKSERSSTDNGSFNSRNTNTLPTQLAPEYDALHRAHGSFSDSFSSLSCGTTHRVTTTHVAPPAAAKPTAPAHSSCRNGFCHCKLFDGTEGHRDFGDRVMEEERKEETQPQTFVSNSPAGDVDEQKEVNAVSLSLQAADGSPASALSQEPQDSVPASDRGAPRVAVVRGVQRFRVVCASCLHAHDPLLTLCHVLAVPEEDLSPQTPESVESPEVVLGSDRPGSSAVLGPPARVSMTRSCVGLGGGSSTDYPSDTEMTATADTLSSASAESHSTYTTWPVGRGPGMARLLQLHPGSHDYVTAWLRHQQARGPRLPTPLHHHHQQPPPESSYSASPEPLDRRHRRFRRRHPRHKDPPRPHLLQDLETVV
ncbi:uncharacterized protein LOC126998406 [Eriocheir sinensis]|uniref:uncharacterized protein LOC126998406 n=1 Tax=Eriocheir sinensis TaxID=95602 RepID=UPI0021C9C6B1|nr:uncharacterized protein LOC126998406 [Eriocheir sinensis]XP_050716020.1 uncharacterized protein LOC126998406 [Eriocheir sinensis]